MKKLEYQATALGSWVFYLYFFLHSYILFTWKTWPSCAHPLDCGAAAAEVGMGIRHPFWARSDSGCSIWKNWCIQRRLWLSSWARTLSLRRSSSCCQGLSDSIRHYLNYDGGGDCLRDAPAVDDTNGARVGGARYWLHLYYFGYYCDGLRLGGRRIHRHSDVYPHWRLLMTRRQSGLAAAVDCGANAYPQTQADSFRDWTPHSLPPHRLYRKTFSSELDLIPGTIAIANKGGHWVFNPFALGWGVCHLIDNSMASLCRMHIQKTVLLLFHWKGLTDEMIITL